MDLHPGRDPDHRHRTGHRCSHVACGSVTAGEDDQLRSPLTQVQGGAPGVFTGGPAGGPADAPGVAERADHGRLEPGFAGGPGTHLGRVGAKIEDVREITEVRKGLGRPRAGGGHGPEREGALYDRGPVGAFEADPPADPGERVDYETDPTPALTPLRHHPVACSRRAR